MNKSFKQTLLTTSILLAIFSPQVYATNGYSAHGFGTVQKAMGGTAVAGHDNAMNIATNPASMSFGENNWTAGLDIFIPDRGMNHAGRPAHQGAPAGAFGPNSPAFPADPNPIPGASLEGNDDSNFPIPEFAYQKKINDAVSVGIAAYGNGGMNATYDRPIFSQTQNTGIDFAQLFVAPSASMKINENHAIGASLNLVYQRIKINGVDAFTPFSRSPNNLSNKGYDSSTGAGVSLGWQGKLSPKLTAGLSYRSETHMDRFDKYKGLLAEQGKFNIPSQITAGVSFQASPKTTFALDVSRINYTDVKSIANDNNTAPLQGQLLNGVAPADLQGPRLGDNDGAGFGWDDQNIVKIGVKHQLNEKLTLLGGYNHGKAPIGSDQTAFNVLAPATVEDHLTLGLDWKLANNSSIAFQYMHAFDNEIKGDGSRDPNTGQPLSPGSLIGIGPSPLDATPANIEMSQDSFGIAYTKNF